MISNELFNKVTPPWRYIFTNVLAIVLLTIFAFELSAKNIIAQYQKRESIDRYLDKAEVTQNLDSIKLLLGEAEQLTKQYQIKDYDIYYRLAMLHSDLNSFNAADSLLDIAIQFAEENGQRARTYSYKAFLALQENNDLQKADSLLKKSRWLIADDTLSTAMLDYLKFKSTYQSRNNDILASIQCLHQIKNLAKELKDDDTYYHSLLNLARELSVFGFYGLKVPVYEELKEAINQYDNLDFKISTLHLLARKNLDEKQYKKAIIDCYTAIRLMEANRAKQEIGCTYFLLGLVFMEQEVLDSSFFYLQASEKANISHNDQFDLSLTDFGLSKYYFKTKDYDQALVHGLRSKSNYPYFNTELNEILFNIYAEKKDFQSAYALSKESNENRAERDRKDVRGKITVELLNQNFNQQLTNTRLKEKIQQMELNYVSRENKILHISLFSTLLLIILVSSLVMVKKYMALKKLA